MNYGNVKLKPNQMSDLGNFEMSIYLKWLL